MDDHESPRRRLTDAEAWRDLSDRVRDLEEWRVRAEPIVSELRDRDMIARAIAERLGEQARGRFSRREQTLGAIGLALVLANTVHTWLR